MKLNAKQLRVTKPTEEQLARIQRKPMWIILDNVLDAYNVGSIFRLADAVAAKEIILCGGSETPPNSRIHKAAVGTEEWVKWRYFKSGIEAIRQLKREYPEGIVFAVEQDPRSIPFQEISIITDDDAPAILVVGNETDGVSKEVLDIADTIVEIPMFGVNKSLNVVVSTAVVLYKVLSN